MADTVSDTSGTAYQNSSTYLFVPGTLGKDSTVATDDSSTPGSYFRLGSYSDMETGAQSNANNRALFFPREHVKDETANGAQGTAKGILLACNGRLLMRSSDATYLHSTGLINIDTEAELTIFAHGDTSLTTDGTLKLTTTSKDITVSAADGKANFTQHAKTVYTNIGLNDWKMTKGDTYTMYWGQTYSWKQGFTVDIVDAMKFSFYLGIGLSITMSVDLTISITAAILLYFAKIEFGVLKVDFSSQKVEVKEGERKITATSLKTMIVGIDQAEVAAKKRDAQVKNDLLIAQAVSIAAEENELMAQNVALKNTIGMQNNM